MLTCVFSQSIKSYLRPGHFQHAVQKETFHGVEDTRKEMDQTMDVATFDTVELTIVGSAEEVKKRNTEVALLRSVSQHMQCIQLKDWLRTG